MPTNFPGSNDTFDIPSVPTTTALGTTGTSARTHTQNHRDLGDAIVAQQAQATYKAHTHDGATFRHGNQLAQANTHQSPDTDAATTSLHHTVGAGANQYASGTHTHAAVATYPVGAFFFAWVSTYPGVTDPVSGNPGLGVVGTWTAVGQRFLCASGGGLGLTLGAVGGSNSHNHTMDATTDTTAAHSHTLSSATTGAGGGHTHNSFGTGSASVSHFHLTYDYTGAFGIAHGDGGFGVPYVYHYHQYNTHTASHSHSTPTPGSTADHTHNLPSTALGNSTPTHNHNNSTPQTANNLIPLFVVYMWQRTA